MYCATCGRKSNIHATCIHQTNYSLTDYLLIILLILLMPGLFLVRAFLVNIEPLPFFKIGLISMNIILIMFTIHDLFFKKKYLPLFFGCHQVVDKSFSINDTLFPICARCTGIYIGIPFSLIFLFVSFHPFIIFIMALPLIADGLFQRFSDYQSTQIKRLLTGMLFAPLLVYLFSLIHLYLFRTVIYLLNVLS